MCSILLFVFTLIALSSTEPSGCGGDRDLRGEEGVIRSHESFGRSDYPNNLNCKWIVTGRRGKVVHLHFDVFSLEQSAGCSADSLSVYDGPNDDSNRLKKLCGSVVPADIYSNGQSLTLKFEIDEDTEELGFRIRYKLVDKVGAAPSAQPIIGPSRVSPGQAEGKPTPSVRMRLAVQRSRWEEQTGSKTAEIIFEKSLNYTLVCEAENIYGKRNQSAVNVVQLSNSSVIIIAAVAGVLPIVILLIILLVLRRKRASTTRETHTLPLIPVGTSVNVSDQLAQTTCVELGLER